MNKEEYDPVCHCGTSLSQHSLYDNHSFVEAPTPEGFHYYQDEARALRYKLAAAREALKKSRDLATTAANYDVDAIVSLEPGTAVFGNHGIANKVLVERAKAAWAEYDALVDAALANSFVRGK